MSTDPAPTQDSAVVGASVQNPSDEGTVAKSATEGSDAPQSLGTADAPQPPQEAPQPALTTAAPAEEAASAPTGSSTADGAPTAPSEAQEVVPNDQPPAAPGSAEPDQVAPTPGTPGASVTVNETIASAASESEVYPPGIPTGLVKAPDGVYVSPDMLDAEGNYKPEHAPVPQGDTPAPTSADHAAGVEKTSVVSEVQGELRKVETFAVSAAKQATYTVVAAAKATEKFVVDIFHDAERGLYRMVHPGTETHTVRKDLAARTPEEAKSEAEALLNVTDGQVLPSGQQVQINVPAAPAP